MCGILISQQSGISTKHNFEIEIVENRILLYIFECQYNMETIETALSIIYSLYSFISVNTNSDKNNIDEITFENIQKEYMEFIKNRNEIINSLNLSIKNLRILKQLLIKIIINYLLLLILFHVQNVIVFLQVFNRYRLIKKFM